jgi:large subunit ribosomal protein L7/L12
MNYYAKVIELMNNMNRLTDIELALAMNNPAAFIRYKEGPPKKYDVILIHYGEKKICCIREIREITGLGLKEAKDMSETPNAIVVNAVDLKTAKKYANDLTACGATVDVKKTNIF